MHQKLLCPMPRHPPHSSVRSGFDIGCTGASRDLLSRPSFQTRNAAACLPEREVVCRSRWSCTYLRAFARVKQYCSPYPYTNFALIPAEDTSTDCGVVLRTADYLLLNVSVS